MCEIFPRGGAIITYVINVKGGFADRDVRWTLGAVCVYGSRTSFRGGKEMEGRFLFI